MNDVRAEYIQPFHDECCPTHGDANHNHASLQSDPSESSAFVFETYKDELERIAGELEYKIAHNATYSQVLKFLDEEMGKKLPVELAKSLKEELIKTWLQGSIVDINDEAVKAQATAVQRLPSAINWFESANRYDYGGVYNDFKDDMAKSIKDIFEGTDSSSKIIERAVKAKEKLGEIFSTLQVQNRYRLVAENAVNKARNFAQALAYEELGITRYQISAIVDQKTSIICRTLNGKVFETKTATKYVNEVLSTDPNKVVAKFPWPDAKTFPQTEDDLRNITPAEINKLYNNMSVKLPPYHAFCRSTVIIQQTTFKQATSISEAETFAKNLGVNANYGSDKNLDIANYINENLHSYQQKNYPLFPNVTIDSKLFSDMPDKDIIPGGFFYKQNSLLINNENSAWKNIQADAIEQRKKEVYSTDNKNHFFNHEYAHFHFHNKFPDEYLKLRKKEVDKDLKETIKKEVSDYATYSVTEFLSETYAGIQDGKVYSKEVMKYFNEYWRQ